MILCANLKCNHTRASFADYAKKLNNFISSNKAHNNEIIIFPPSSAFYGGSVSFIQGAQNFYPTVNGSFTGQIGEEMLNEFGIKTVLIGHSECRKIGENDEFLQEKFKFATKRNWRVIYCIGESEDVFKNGKSADFIQNQAKNIDLSYNNLILAYEPIFSIGTGVSADMEHIFAMTKALRNITSAPILYGGSVNDKNITDIISIDGCKGVLVGTASWQIDKFIELINTAKK